MRRGAIDYIGKGKPPKSDLREYNEQVDIGIDPATGNLYYVNGLTVFQLERQDELQEMVRGEFKNLETFVYFFWSWMARKQVEIIDGFNSMEQLWLAFVMNEKYKKVWNGDKWIKQT